MKNSNQHENASNKPGDDRKRLYQMLSESAFGVFLWFFIPFNLLLILNEPFQVKRNREVIQERLQRVDHSLHNLAFPSSLANVRERDQLRSNLLKRKSCYQRIITSNWKASPSTCLNSTGDDFKAKETLQDYRYWHSPGFYLQRIFWLFMPLYLYFLNRYLIGRLSGLEERKPKSMRQLKSWLSLKNRRPTVRGA